MTKEGEPAQPTLFAGELYETDSSMLAVALPVVGIADSSEQNEGIAPTPVTAEPAPLERETPKATLRDVRAVRSLFYNRLLLEVVQRRIEKAETIILSYLLMQGSTTAQIGPYWVELDPSDHVCLTRTETDDDWRQLYFPEVEAVSGA